MPSIIPQGSAVKKTFKFIFSELLDEPVGMNVKRNTIQGGSTQQIIVILEQLYMGKGNKELVTVYDGTCTCLHKQLRFFVGKHSIHKKSTYSQRTLCTPVQSEQHPVLETLDTVFVPLAQMNFQAQSTGRPLNPCNYEPPVRSLPKTHRIEPQGYAYID